MTDLTHEECVACRRDAPRVSELEASQLRLQIPEWVLVSLDEVPRLEREFRFADFSEE